MRVPVDRPPSAPGWVPAALGLGAVVAAWAAVVLVTLGAHPLLRGPGPLPERADDLGRTTRQAIERLLLLGEVDPGAVPAVLALVLATLYVAGYLLRAPGRSAGPPGAAGAAGEPPAAGGAPGAIGRVPHGPALAGLAGHLGGWLVAERGGSPAAMQCAVLGIALVAGLVLLRRGSRAPAAREAASPPPVRSAMLVTGGLLLVLALKPLDVLIAWWLETPQVPELWFVLAEATFAPRPITVVLVLLALASLPVLAAVGRSAGRSAGRGSGAGQILLTTPAWALVLGPSNPFQALGVAFGLFHMQDAGASLPWRIAFIGSAVGLPVLAASLL